MLHQQAALLAYTAVMDVRLGFECNSEIPFAVCAFSQLAMLCL